MNKQKCQIIHWKSSRILKAAWKQVAEVGRKSDCFFPDSMEILAYWWVAVTHNSTQMSDRSLSYLNSNPHGDFSQQQQTLTLEFPHASFLEAAKSIPYSKRN